MNTLLFSMLLVFQAKTDQVSLRFITEENRPLVGLHVRIETPLGAMATVTDTEGQIRVPSSYPRLTVFFGDPNRLIRLPDDLDLSKFEGQEATIVVSRELLSRINGGD